MCYLVEIPYKIIYETSINSTPAGRHVVVQIHTDNCLRGWGETGIISKNYPEQGDTPEGMMSVIQHYLAPAIIGMDPNAIDVIMTKLDQTIKGHYFAKCAIDHAIYDLAGKAQGLSVATLLGGMHRTDFVCSRSLPLGAPEIVAERAKYLQNLGYKCLTLKGGKDYKTDIAAFAATRKAVGNNFPLEIDPNGGYDRKNAITAILEMEQHDLSAVEQPVKGNDLASMAAIKDRISTKLIADESIFNMNDLTNVISMNAADVICLKPFKSGGLFFSKKLQFVSESFHLEVSTGSMHPFGIGTAALHQFIASMNKVATTGYGAPLERFADDIVDENCFTFEDGVVKLFDKPGLGLEVNTGKLEKYTKKFVLIK